MDVNIAYFYIRSFSIRTIPSVWELHPINLKRLADYTAGEDFHLAPKQLLS